MLLQFLIHIKWIHYSIFTVFIVKLTQYCYAKFYGNLEKKHIQLFVSVSLFFSFFPLIFFPSYFFLSDLDFTHFLSTPQMALDCFLYNTKAKVQLLTDWDKQAIFEQNLKGGVSFIAERHCLAEYDEKTRKHTVLLYLDENNLYVRIYYIFFISTRPLPLLSVPTIALVPMELLCLLSVLY